MGLKGVKVNGQTYHFDHEYLENNPIPTFDTHYDVDKVLGVGSSNSGYSLMWMEVIPPFDPTEGNDLHYVLTVEESSLEWEPADRFLAAHAANDGDVLTVERDGSHTELVWKSIDGGSSSLPTYDTTYPSSDEGKVLSINDYGDLEWMTPDGGSSPLPTYDTTYPSVDEGKVLTVNDYGNLVWETPDGSLPEIPTNSTVSSPLVLTANDDSAEWGQINDILCVGASDGVLTYHSGNVMWSSVFPSYDGSDAGKVLTVNDAGELEWAMPS